MTADQAVRVLESAADELPLNDWQRLHVSEFARFAKLGDKHGMRLFFPEVQRTFSDQRIIESLEWRIPNNGG